MQRRASAPPNPPARASRPGLAATALALAILSVAGGTRAAFNPEPTVPPTLVPITGGRDYLRLDPVQPLVFEVQGPGEFYGYVRAHFASGESGEKTGRLVVLGVADAPAATALTFTPSTESRYADEREGVPSGGRRFSVVVPDGRHRVELRAEAADGAEVFALVYYEGPPQPSDAAAAPSVARASAGDDEEEDDGGLEVEFRRRVGLEFIYDSNILSLSDEDLADLHVVIDPVESREEFTPDRGVDPDEFRIRTPDDAILSPSLDIEARARLVDWGSTRLRAKFQTWRYLYNPIKNNLEWDFYLRQYLAYGRSVELYYFYAPQQYLWQLRDTAPYSDPEESSVIEEFRFAKNVLGVSVRERLSRDVNIQLTHERNHRYYNQPFMENDIEAWELRGRLSIDLHQRLGLDLDYSYEDGPARGTDQVGETREFSDNSDASYKRDLYRVGITWRQPFLRWLCDRIDVVGLAMFYWYPAEFQEPFEDRYHVGRKDNVYKVSVELRRSLAKGLSADLGSRYTVRTIDSPWPEVIDIDKAYTKYRIWFSLSYSP